MDENESGCLGNGNRRRKQCKIGITDQTHEETSMCLFKRMGVSGLHKDLENGRMGFGVVCSGFGFEA